MMKIKNGYVVKITASPDMATVLKTNSDLSLEFLQKQVGGLIQVIKTDFPKVLMILDEEGKLKRKRVNLTATNIGNLPLYDCIVGDVLLVKDKGTDMAVFTEEEANELMNELSRCSDE